MSMLPALTERRARRALSAEPLPEGALGLILEAGTLAPSCYNNQPWRLVASALGDESLPALRAALAPGNAWALVAPAIVAIAVREADDCRLDDGRDYALLDAGLCAMALMTQATALGLIAHPIAGFSPKKAKAALGVPADHVLPVLVVLARPGGPEALAALEPWQRDAEAAPRERRSLGEVAFRGSWGRPAT